MVYLQKCRIPCIQDFDIVEKCENVIIKMTEIIALVTFELTLISSKIKVQSRQRTLGHQVIAIFSGKESNAYNRIRLDFADTDR